jgi:predicted DCC family thiol-disulfide oxidoreductase YuxK
MPASGAALPPGLSLPARLLVFDGVCVLCSGTVQFILKHEKAPGFSFAPVQSALGQRVLAALGQPLDGNDSFVVTDNGRYYLRTEAAIQIARAMKAPWSWLAAVRVLPRAWGDAAYDWLARRRYRIFGRYDSCMLPDAAHRERFLL